MKYDTKGQGYPYLDPDTHGSTEITMLYVDVIQNGSGSASRDHRRLHTLQAYSHQNCRTLYGAAGAQAMVEGSHCKPTNWK